MSPRVFSTDVAVRSYEVDFGGVVNNAVWINYLEHARMDIFHELGVSFAAWARRGVLVVVRRLEVEYHRAVSLGDHLTVESWIEAVGRTSVKVGQRAIAPDGTVLLEAQVVGVFVGPELRPIPVPEELRGLLPPDAVGPRP